MKRTKVRGRAGGGGRTAPQEWLRLAQVGGEQRSIVNGVLPTAVLAVLVVMMGTIDGRGE